MSEFERVKDLKECQPGNTYEILLETWRRYVTPGYYVEALYEDINAGRGRIWEIIEIHNDPVRDEEQVAIVKCTEWAMMA